MTGALLCECGQQNAAGREFCQACNAYLEFSAKPVAASPASPPTTQNETGASAGAGVSAPSTEEVPTLEVPAASATPSAAFPDRPNTEAWRRCPSCNENNETSRSFCKRCGTTLPQHEPNAAALIAVGLFLFVPGLRSIFSSEGTFEPRVPVDVIALQSGLAPAEDPCGVSLAGGASPEDALIDGATFTYWATSVEEPVVRFEMGETPVSVRAIGIHNGSGTCPAAPGFSRAPTAMELTFFNQVDGERRVVSTFEVPLSESTGFQVHEIRSGKFTRVDVRFVDSGVDDDVLRTPLAVAEVEFFE